MNLLDVGDLSNNRRWEIQTVQMFLLAWKQISRCPFVYPLWDQFVLKNEHDLPVMVTVTPFIKNGTLHKRIEAEGKLPAVEAWHVEPCSTIESSKSTDIGIYHGLSFLGNVESPRNLQ